MFAQHKIAGLLQVFVSPPVSSQQQLDPKQSGCYIFSYDLFFDIFGWMDGWMDPSSRHVFFFVFFFIMPHSQTNVEMI